MHITKISPEVNDIGLTNYLSALLMVHHISQLRRQVLLQARHAHHDMKQTSSPTSNSDTPSYPSVRAVILSKLQYTSCAWWSFTKASDRQRINRQIH